MKNKPLEVAPMIDPPMLPEPQRDPKERLQALLSGTEPASSKFQDYLVEKVKKVREERDDIVKALRHMEEQARTLSQRQLDLEAQSNAYLDDILQWDDPDAA